VSLATLHCLLWVTAPGRSSEERQGSGKQRVMRDRKPASPTGCEPDGLWHIAAMGVRTWIDSWPVYRQLTSTDPLGRGKAAQSPRSRDLEPRTVTADRVAHSVCPYCAVGCAQKVYVKDEQVVQIEGNPDSPISRGRLCPKGSASKQLVTGPQREQKVMYRAPYATQWSELDLETAMDMVTQRFLEARRKGWQDTDPQGRFVRRTLGIASLGGATLDNEENYIIKKLFTAAGAIQIENQARI
jgi:formate dehydrogenase major subunit